MFCLGKLLENEKMLLTISTCPFAQKITQVPVKIIPGLAATGYAEAKVSKIVAAVSKRVGLPKWVLKKL